MTTYNLLADAGAVWNTIWSVLVALLILLFMITVHEFGHYITGKIFKFKINEFAIGFGPKLFSKTKKNGEIFSIRALPLGGFCAFEGEDDDGNCTDPNAFNNKKPWERIIVLIAGATMNYLVSVLLIVLSFAIYGQNLLIIVKNEAYVPDPVTVEYSFQSYDTILKVEGKDVYMISDVIEALSDNEEGDLVDFVIKRRYENADGSKYFKEENVKILLRSNPVAENIGDAKTATKALGIEYTSDTETNELFVHGEHFGVFETIGRSVNYSFKIGSSIFTVIGELFTGKLGIDTLSGPVGTVVMTSQIVQNGFNSFLQITFFIGVNLAVMNLLPFPALDGSKVVFTIIEWIRKKPNNRKLENIVSLVGLAVLIGFAVLVDLLKLF